MPRHAMGVALPEEPGRQSDAPVPEGDLVEEVGLLAATEGTRSAKGCSSSTQQPNSKKQAAHLKLAAERERADRRGQAAARRCYVALDEHLLLGRRVQQRREGDGVDPEEGIGREALGLRKERNEQALRERAIPGGYMATAPPTLRCAARGSSSRRRRCACGSCASSRGQRIAR